MLTSLNERTPAPLPRPRGGWSWFAERRRVQKERAALAIHVASPVFGDLRQYVIAPAAVVGEDADKYKKKEARKRSAAAATARFRPESLDLAPAPAQGPAPPGPPFADPVVKRPRRNLNGCVRLLWSLLAGLATLAVLPVALLLFPAVVLFTLVRSTRANVLYPFGVLRRERALFALNYVLLLLLLMLLMVTVFMFGPNVATLGVNAVGFAVMSLLIATAIPVWIFLVSTNTHRYWNRVPGGLTRTTLRWTFANMRTIVALLFTAVQLASFPIARLHAVAVVASLGVGNSTAPLYIPGISELSAEQLARVYATVESVSAIIFGNLPLDAFFVILLWASVVAVLVWVIWLAVPVTQQLLLVWWIGALQSPLSGSEGVEGSVELEAEVSSTEQGQAPCNGRALDPEAAQDALNGGAGAAAVAAAAVAAAGGGGEKQRRRTCMSQLAFDLARGRYFVRYLYGQRIHGFVQYLLGDLFFVTITSNLLRSINCKEVCVMLSNSGSGSGSGSGSAADELVCVGMLFAAPSQQCWVTTQHQLMAALGMTAFFVYVYTATFTTPLMVDVLNKGDTLDIRITPRFAVMDRIMELTIITSYILIDPSLAIAPIIIQIVVGLVLVIYIERTRPGSDRTILLRSCLYQINLWIPMAALTAYTRVPWIPLIVMAAGVALILLISFARYLPMRRRLSGRTLRLLARGLGGDDDDDLDREGLVRVRGLDQHLVQEGNDALAAGDAAAAIQRYKRALFNAPTQAEAACCLATMAYEGRYMPRYLASSMHIAQTFLASHSRRGTRLTPARLETLRVLRFLCQWELGLPVTERFGDVLAWLDREARQTHKTAGFGEQTTSGLGAAPSSGPVPSSMTSPNAWCLLGLMYERVGVVGVSGLVNRQGSQALRQTSRQQFFVLALACMKRGATMPGGFIPTLHWARYAVDGLGGPPPDPNHARKLLAYLADTGAYPHVSTFLQRLQFASVNLEGGATDTWHATAGPVNLNLNDVEMGLVRPLQGPGRADESTDHLGVPSRLSVGGGWATASGSAFDLASGVADRTAAAAEALYDATTADLAPHWVPPPAAASGAEHDPCT